MKKKILVVISLFALFISGCGSRGNDGKTGNEELKGNIYISERDEKSEIEFEGEETPAVSSLYTGNGYSIYIPDDEFRKGMDFDDILAFVTANPPQGLDVKALRIELKANHFYRGNPYVNAVGALLGFTSEQLDKFFKTNDYTCLLEASNE